jgi:uncharacterized membrane protein YeaQ/YmgE (transglycosylase-associated protein family)
MSATTLLVLLAMWLVIGLLMGVLAGTIWKEARPYGDFADYLVSAVVAILTGLGDWFLLPLLNITGALRLIAAVLEPALMALIALWVMRLIKKRQTA